MKFSDGNWHDREGMDVHTPAEVHDFVYDDHSLTLYAPCKEIAHRGATLNLPMITVRLSSPMADVVRVQITHHEGEVAKKPEFKLHVDGAMVQVEEQDSHLTLTSGNLQARIRREGWGIEFFDGDRRLTGSGHKAMAYIIDNGKQAYMREQLDLGVGEQVYGLGERFTPFVKNGQVVDIWNEDGGTSSEQSYKNIPFYVTNQGYGVFVNHPERVSFEVASEKVEKSQFSVEGETLDYFIINGPTIKEALGRYTSLTGKPAIPPAWSFGLWLSTSFTTNYDEETVTHFVDGMFERDIPLRVFHFDCFWMKEFEWCNFEWDDRFFPDPEGMLRRLKAKGLNISLWLNSYIGQKSPLFKEGAKHGYLLKRPDGDVWQWDMWQAGMGLVDFTNPEARKWFTGKLKALMDMGVDAFKTDFGERIPTNVEYYDKSDPVKMHNYYPFIYNKTVFDLLREHRGEGDAVLFARSATVGGQQFPVHWGGDCSATYPSMAETLRGGLSLGLSGFGFWSHDIGGFEDTSTPDLYKRWVAFGLLSSHSRLHGSSSYRVPWLYDEEAVDVVRFFTKLKHSLMPYIFANAVAAHQHGLPLMRAMVLEFNGDLTAHTLDRQYMLGPSLLVAPIFNENGIGQYYLPKGQWTHFISGVEVEGGRWLEEYYDYLSLPLFARENSVIPVGADTSKPDYEFADGVTYHAFAIQDGARIEVPLYDLGGNLQTTARLTRIGDTLTFEVQGAGSTAGSGTATAGTTKPWTLVLRNASIVSVTGGEAKVEGSDARIVPASVTGKLEIQLSPRK